VVLFILPPLSLAVWAIHRWQSPGRLFYTQSRAGRSGEPFRIWKYRTMHESNGDERVQARRDDDRIFPLGRLLRRTSLDEMPQFINVLLGDMSVVGPRPHLDAHEEVFAKSAEVYRMRFFVKPGITGLAQSRGYRGEAGNVAEVQERIRLDLIYIRSWSVWLDIVIIVRTLGAVMMPPRSAY
jgi:putative colanic acid biosynthesis UDP-glucose lipid carrier transferase